MDMTEPSKFLQPAPMEGKWAYNRSSCVQATSSVPAVRLLERAAHAMALSTSPEPLVIADYGSSQGHNSLVPMATAIDALRERVGHERVIFVFHTDLPGNDFTALFRTLATDPNSYLRNDSATFGAAIGRSYFEQILPASSVTVGWSAWAIQWVSRVPCAIPDQVQIAYSRDVAARSAFARQAEEDWRTFLAMRSRELCSDGRLVVITMATDDSGDFGYRPVVNALYGTLLDMAARGLIREEEFRRMVIPTVGRTRAQLMEPFAKTGRCADLSLEEFELFHAEDRIWTQFEANRDAQTFGAQWAAFCRASVFPTLAAALNGAPDAARSAEFMEQLETGVAAELSASPVRMIIPLAQLMLVKTSDGK
jgi:SAM dependent carboxyl methyltransferase